ncbi:hypothetical protein L484_006494 [Morus notabilis]|uniref:Uncharacterized protein n=1 Tax=Morus notabilis TaxID=981085 RepID=W9RGB8_9ROSA|nr:hypothetical protein L484_006494 [Morus notabilis]
MRTSLSEPYIGWWDPMRLQSYWRAKAMATRRSKSLVGPSEWAWRWWFRGGGGGVIHLSEVLSSQPPVISSAKSSPAPVLSLNKLAFCSYFQF